MDEFYDHTGLYLRHFADLIQAVFGFCVDVRGKWAALDGSDVFGQVLGVHRADDGGVAMGMADGES